MPKTAPKPPPTAATAPVTIFTPPNDPRWELPGQPTPAALNALALHQPRNDRELWQYCAMIWGIKIPARRVCSSHVSPFRAFADAYFARNTVNIWWAARAFGGKSFTLALLGLTNQVTLGAEVSILGGTGEQSKRVLNYLKCRDAKSRDKFWGAEYAPKGLKDGEITGTESKTIAFGNRPPGILTCLMASDASVRGPHPQRLLIDETDCVDWDILDTAMGQTISTFNKDGTYAIRKCTVLSSTWQNPDGTLTKLMKMAKDPSRTGWRIYPWCWRENITTNGGWLHPDEVEAKRNEVSRHAWDIEFELGEPALDGTVIDPMAVERAFDPELGWVEGEENTLYIFEDPHPELVEAQMYHTGTDWAKKKDWTCIPTFRKGEEDEDTGRLRTPDVCVAWARYGRMPWPIQVNKLNERLTWYPGGSAHDGTGIGDVLGDYLEFDSDGFIMGGGRARSEFFMAYINALEHGYIKYPRIQYAYEEHKFCTWDMLFGNGHPPDTVVAGAMAWRARNLSGAAAGASADEDGDSAREMEMERELNLFHRGQL